MKYFQVTYNLSVCFSHWKSPSSPPPPVSGLRCVCNRSLESPGHKCFQAVLTLAVGGSCVFGCATALLTGFRNSPSSGMGKVSQDPRYWEDALVICTMAGMPSAWCTVSKQQMLFCCSRARCGWVIGVLQMLPWSFFFAPYPETINLSGGMCLHCTCCYPCWTDTVTAYHCINPAICYPVLCYREKSCPERNGLQFCCWTICRGLLHYRMSKE